jgi:GT2 family glycosyltransferase
MTTADSAYPELVPATDPQRGTPLAPRVYAVLVVNNAGEWLSEVLDTFATQNYPDLDLVVVDNGSNDRSAAIIEERVPAEHRVYFRRNVGFGRAVMAALARTDLAETDFVLLLHDDLVLAPDAVARMVEAFRADPSLSIVGPKLREWSTEPILQEVGGTIDRFGRIEPPVEPGELDQGQHDRQREVLYTSTAGMLVRAEALRDLGGFDTRYLAFRDDLDLCWRAWLHGHRVEVVPAAVGFHIGAATRRLRRLGLGRSPRELAERHSLSTLATCYELRRLAWILPVVFLLALAKIVGFLLTRRFSDAIAVLRAYAWNLLKLPSTISRRRRVQRSRTVSDAELGWLFAPGLPRARHYVEAVGEWVAGGSTRAFLTDPDELPPAQVDQTNPVVRSLREHPAAWAGGALGFVYLVGLIPLLGPGALVGGEVLPWPSSPFAFLRSFGSAWSGEPFGSAAPASPAQAILGVLSMAGLGSAWLAQRLIVLGLLPLAWVTALRAGRLVTARPAPRVLGATLYALSPVLVGALNHGLIGVLAVAALLPALILLAVRVVAPAELWSGAGTDVSSIEGAVTASAWRSAALLALGLAACLAVAPSLWVLVAALYLVTLAAAILRRDGVVRVVALGVSTFALLAPWLLGLYREGWPVNAGVREVAALPLWRALGVVPDVLPGLEGAGGLVMGVCALAVFVPALAALRGRQVLIIGLVSVFCTSVLSAWVVARLGVDQLWAPALLLPAALALAGLGVVAGQWLTHGLRTTNQGLRQFALVGSVALVGACLVIATVRLGAGPYDSLTRARTLLPPFITADEQEVGPYRVLLVGSDDDGAVTFEAVSSSGVSMTSFGTVPSRSMVTALSAAVENAVGGTSPSAATTLGILGVRYVVLAPDVDRTFVAALDRQTALSPAPLDGGRVYEVTAWLPRATVLPPETGRQVVVAGATGTLPDAAERGLERLRNDYYARAEVPREGGLLVLSEAESSRWRATAGGEELERRIPPADAAGAALPLNAFLVEPEARDLEVGAASRGHLLALLAQLATLLAVASLAARPPGGARRTAQPRRPGGGATAQQRFESPLDDVIDITSAPAPPVPERTPMSST